MSFKLFLIISLLGLYSCMPKAEKVKKKVDILSQDNGVVSNNENPTYKQNILSSAHCAADCGSSIVMPIEVYPDLSTAEYSELYGNSDTNPGEVGRSFNLASSSQVNRLYIRGHRLGYTDHFNKREKDSKSLVKVNNGPWFLLRNSHVEMSIKERKYGGIGGGFRTNKVYIDINKLGGTKVLKNGGNKIFFKMNATDGVTNGFRILHFELQDRAGKNLVANNYVESNPNNWKATNTQHADLIHGKKLFQTRDLLTDRGKKVTASCSDCHTQDGRDLEYFAFSNGSIVARSKFHGLSFEQGKKIASYIRSFSSKGIKRIGRPWNPPYQPGPGIDSRPIDEWAAGAGLDAVLKTDEEMKPYLFPLGATKNGILHTLKLGTTTNSEINTREIPVSIQLPDWNDWLPTVHPVDIWDTDYIFNLESNSHGFFALENKIQNAINEKNFGYEKSYSAGFLLERLTGDAFNFMMRGARKADFPLRVLEGEITDKRRPDVSHELANNAMSKTIAVRTFDVMTKLKLEDKAKLIYGDHLAEKRQWPIRQFSVFQVAPHIHSLNRQNFESSDINQSTLKGKYDSVAWYHLQIVLNAGGEVRKDIYPVDWDYQYSFINYLAQESTEITPYLNMLTLIKGMQNNTTPFGINNKGFMTRFAKPHWIYSTSILQMGDVGVRKNFMEAFLRNYLDLTEIHYGVMMWDGTRYSSNDGDLSRKWTRLISREEVPGEFDQGFSFFNNNADNAYNFSKLLYEQSLVSDSSLESYLSFVKNLWPKGDFEKFSKSQVVEIPLGTTLNKGSSLQTSKYKLIFQNDGNLILRGEHDVEWSSETTGIGHVAAYQNDGNFVIYNIKGQAVYSTNTTSSKSMLLTNLAGLMINDDIISRTLESDKPFEIFKGSVFQAGRFKLTFQHDGNFVARTLSGVVLWESGTAGKGHTMYLEDNGQLKMYNRSKKGVWKYRGESTPYLRLNDRGFYIGNKNVFSSNEFYPAQDIVVNPGEDEHENTKTEQGQPPSQDTPVDQNPTDNVARPDRVRLEKGYIFKKGESFKVNGRIMAFQQDGNFVIYNNSLQPIFATDTYKRGEVMAFQNDGNLVIYDKHSNAIFASNTYRKGSYLQFQSDGNLVIYNSSDQAVWATDTNNR